jgi:hypothetical protein
MAKSVLRRYQQNAVARLRLVSFDAIVYKTLSGSAVAPAVAATLKKPLILVRRHTANGATTATGAVSVGTYVIITDFAALDTVLVTHRVIADAIVAHCVGVYLYQTDELITAVNLDYPIWASIFSS